MKTHQWTTKIFVMLGISFLPMIVQAASPLCRSFEGEAHLQKDQKLVYRERYQIDCPPNAPRSVKITFLDPSGKVMAEQTSTESKLPYVFATKFQDMRDGYQYEIEPQKDGQVTVIQVDHPKATPERKTIDDGSGLMNFIGAMRFIEDNLADLVKGETKKARFIIPSRGDAYSIAISAEKSADGKSADIHIELTNPLYRAFAPKMALTYDVAEKRLVKFTGNAALLDEHDKPMLVDTSYHFIN